MKDLKRKDLIYPDLSYQVIGALFEAYNELGPGYGEKHYQKAIAKSFKDCKLSFSEQVHVPLIFKKEKIGEYYLDFLIEDKMVLEIKKGDRFSKKNIEQVFSYLKVKGLKLGILANFGQKGVNFRRIINFDS